MRQLRLRKVESFLQSNAASECKGEGFHPGLSDSRAHAFYAFKSLALRRDKGKVLLGMSVNDQAGL